MKKWKWWQRLLLGMALLLGLAAAYAFWPISPDLSALENANEGYEVRILRDTWGVPHIFGQTDADTAFGLAYAHAEDDFLTIQQAAVAARGQLAGVYGIDAAPNDYMVQLLRIWETIDQHYESDISPPMQRMLEAYADGLNYYAALHPEAVLPGLFPVRAQDIVAGFIHKIPLFYGLDGVLGALYADERQNTVSDRGEPTASLFPGGINQYGSNTFSVGPGRSADGETFLAVNTHQPWEGLATWYEAHTHSEEGLDMVGGLFPGAPTISHGHNRHLGWSFTVNHPDLVDVYVLDINPDNPDQYRFDGRWLDLEVRQAPIRVKLLGRLSWTVKREVLWSIYGPTVRQDHGTYAIRYAGIGQVDFVEQFYWLAKARNFDEWQSAMRQGSLPMFNTGYADAAGNIYYVYNAKLPLRHEAYDWNQYLPGNTSETLWTDYLPFDDLPQVMNPPSGFVQNANSTPFRTTLGPGNPDPTDYSPTFGIESRMSNRALRALELFGGDDSITEAEFQAYKYDVTYSAESDMAAMVDRLVAAVDANDPATREAVALLTAWDRRATPESSGASLAIMTLYFAGQNAALQLEISRLTENEIPLDDLLSSFDQAVSFLQENYGRVAVPWQEINRLRRGQLDLGVGGGPDLAHAVYGRLEDDGRLRGADGDGYVQLVTWDANGKVHARSIHQFGSATLDETSSHYADQSPLFAQRQLKEIWLDEAEIRANLEREYRPGEELDE